MRKYGFRIGNVGVEFSSVDARDNAIKTFTKGSDVVISNIGIRFSDGEGNFSVYDRDTREVLTNCCACMGVFLEQTCSRRSYPDKYSYEKSYSNREGYICDACLAMKEKEKARLETIRTLNEEED